MHSKIYITQKSILVGILVNLNCLSILSFRNYGQFNQSALLYARYTSRNLTETSFIIFATF